MYSKISVFLILSAVATLSHAKCNYISQQDPVSIGKIMPTANCGSGLFCFATVSCPDEAVKSKNIICKPKSSTAAQVVCPDADVCATESKSFARPAAFLSTRPGDFKKDSPSERMEGR